MDQLWSGVRALPRIIEVQQFISKKFGHFGNVGFIPLKCATNASLFCMHKYFL